MDVWNSVSTSVSFIIFHARQDADDEELSSALSLLSSHAIVGPWRALFVSNDAETFPLSFFLDKFRDQRLNRSLRQSRAHYMTSPGVANGPTHTNQNEEAVRETMSDEEEVRQRTAPAVS